MAVFRHFRREPKTTLFGNARCDRDRSPIRNFYMGTRTYPETALPLFRRSPKTTLFGECVAIVTGVRFATFIWVQGRAPKQRRRCFGAHQKPRFLVSALRS